MYSRNFIEEEEKKIKFMKERIKTAGCENARDSGDARWNCFTKVFVFFIGWTGRDVQYLGDDDEISSTAAGASLDESLSCAGQLSNARWSNGRTQFDQPSRDDEDSSSLIHKFMGSRDVGRLVIGPGATSSSS